MVAQNGLVAWKYGAWSVNLRVQQYSDGRKNIDMQISYCKRVVDEVNGVAGVAYDGSVDG